MLFHAAPILLKPGSVILPGNYGRILEAAGRSHTSWEREQVLEHVRQQYFPHLPSRLKACFACSSEATIKFLSNQVLSRGPFSMNVLYAVEKVDQDAPEHRTDFNVVEPLPGRSETMEEIAELYWRASLWCDIIGFPGLKCEEVVTASPLRIVATLEENRPEQ